MMRRHPRVARLERREDVARLAAVLHHRDFVVTADGSLVDVGTPVRESAALALGRLGGPEATEALLGALRDDHTLQVRRAALSALVTHDDPKTAAAIAEVVLGWTAP